MADLMRMQQLKLGCGGTKRDILELPAGMAMFVTWLCRAHPGESGESWGSDSFSLRLSWWGLLGLVKSSAEAEFRGINFMRNLLCYERSRALATQ